jgi:hypothetical protein
MALAIRVEGLLKQGTVADYAAVARLGKVTRARMTHVMNLLHLASDIQETILFLPRRASGRDPITERELRPLTRIVGWSEQRRAWAELLGGRPPIGAEIAVDFRRPISLSAGEDAR